MRLICPSCTTAYAVPDQALTGKHMVRCGRCQTRWTPVAASPPATDVALVTPAAVGLSATAPTLVAHTHEYPRPAWWRDAGYSPALLAAWMASLVLIAGAVALLLIRHHAIAAAWPPMRRLYGWFGL